MQLLNNWGLKGVQISCGLYKIQGKLTYSPITLWENMSPTVDTKFSKLNNCTFYERKCPICYQQRLQIILLACKCLASGLLVLP